MRTIEQHNAILNEQAKNITTSVMLKAKQFGHPYLWNSSYWRGYCDALDESGELFKLVHSMVIPQLNNKPVIS